jgi:cbb3-type cytochrome oxidase subunit 1
MPPLTRLFVKSALAYFIAALMVGSVFALPSPSALPPIINALRPVYFHLFMVGWVTQLIFGVAFWMFPKLSRTQPRGSERLAWATYWLLNVGLWLRVAGEPLNSVQPGNLWAWLLPLSATLQWLAGLCFVLNTWPRVKEK